jgi:cell division protein FtsB
VNEGVIAHRALAVVADREQPDMIGMGERCFSAAAARQATARRGRVILETVRPSAQVIEAGRRSLETLKAPRVLA